MKNPTDIQEIKKVTQITNVSITNPKTRVLKKSKDPYELINPSRVIGNRKRSAINTPISPPIT
ncbi:MAG: hypothetical protein GY710_21200 [Desulfobacteraceae bacterium]|nr:hypothetical protein [Desulfobacteraceae bacterium]